MKPPRVPRALFAAALAVALAPSVLAAPPPPQTVRPEAADDPRAATLPDVPLRAYDPAGARARPEDARGWDEEPGIESEDVLLFVPRAVLFVPQTVLRLAFLPLQGGIYLVDEYKLIARYRDIFYSDDGTRGITPSVGYQSGYGFTAGLSIFDTDLFGHDEELRLKVSFGGRFVQFYQLSFGGDHVGGSALWLEAVARYEAQPALYFYGIGDQERDGSLTPPAGGFDPRAVARATRFRQDRVLGVLNIGGSVGDPGRPIVHDDVEGWERGAVVRFGASFIFNHRDYGPEERDYDEPSIEEVYDTSRLAGFDDGSITLESLATLIVDTRDKTGQTSSGTYVHLFGGAALPVQDYAYGHFGGEITGWIDLYRGDRVLQLRAMLEGVTGDADDIPFTELPRLGGANRLRGFDDGRFRDRVAALASVAYFYPVHQFVQGELFVDAGRVGPDVGDALDLAEWHFGGGLGFVVSDPDDVLFRFELSYAGEGLMLYVSTDRFAAFDDREEQL